MKKIFGLIFLIAWVAGELPRFLWPWPVTLLDAAVGLMVIAGGIRGMRGIWRISLTVIASWGLGLRLFSLEQSIPGGLYLVRFIGYLWVIVHAERLLAPVKKFITPALWVFVMLGLLQYVVIPDTRFLLRYGWDEHYYRLIGTVLDPNYAGAMLGVIALFAMERFLAHRNVSMALLVAASTIGLTLTFSRASWLASGVALIIYTSVRSLTKFARSLSPTLRQLADRGGLTTATSSQRKFVNFVNRSSLHLLLLTIVVFFIVALVIAPKPGGEGVRIFRTNSILQRTESWQQALTIWRSHPFIGVGFNNYSIASQRIGFHIDPKNHAANSPDSSWLLLLSTAGVIGVIGVMWGIRGHMSFLIKEKLLFSIVLLVCVHSLFNNTLFYPPMLGLVALMVASSR